MKVAGWQIERVATYVPCLRIKRVKLTDSPIWSYPISDWLWPRAWEVQCNLHRHKWVCTTWQLAIATGMDHLGAFSVETKEWVNARVRTASRS